MDLQLQHAPHVSNIAKKCLLTYKLLVLEHASNTLQRGLRNITTKANEEVQGFLSSSLPSSLDWDQMMRVLDAKCHAVDKLVGLVKDIANVPKFCLNTTAEEGAMAILRRPPTDEGIMMTSGVLKFGPMLQNVLMASSITKAVQVLGATLSLQQLQRFLVGPSDAAQKDVLFCGISSSLNAVAELSTSSGHETAKGKAENAVLFREKAQPGVAVEMPAIIRGKDKTDKPKPPSLLRPILSVMSKREPVKICVGPPPQSGSSLGPQKYVQVKHQKQTVSQLLNFIRTNGKSKGVITLIERWNYFQYTTSLSPPTSPPGKANGQQVGGDAAGGGPGCNDMPGLKRQLLAEMENQSPIFKVKRMESCGSLTYTCMIASKTELWDLGDILTEASYSCQKEMDGQHQKGTSHTATPTVNPRMETQRVRATEPQDRSAVVLSRVEPICIPEFQIRKFEEMEVVVSHIVSPGSFYIQCANSVTQQQAVAAVWNGGVSFAEQNCIPDIGMHVVSWFPGQELWCRAQVTKICGMSGDIGTTGSGGRMTDIQVEVKRLDYGDTSCLSLWNMKELTPEMAALPLQAVQVSLAHVTPADGRDWSLESVEWFTAMVNNRMLYARLYPQATKIMVELFLEKGKIGAMRRGASLSLRLAQNGHAKHDKLKHTGMFKNSAAEVGMKSQESAWEKQLISCYTQSRK